MRYGTLSLGSHVVGALQTTDDGALALRVALRRTAMTAALWPDEPILGDIDLRWLPFRWVEQGEGARAPSWVYFTENAFMASGHDLLADRLPIIVSDCLLDAWSA